LTTGCAVSGGTCNWRTFAPIALGLATASIVDTFFGLSSDTLPFIPFSLHLAGVGVDAVPLPAALPLFATGLGVLGLLGWRRKKKAAALAA
jgi:hypothetical protein